MIDFKVVPDAGEPYAITATARDVLRWEKTSRGKTFQGLMDNLSMVDLYALAWHASIRQGQLARDVSLKDFEDTHEVEFEGETDLDPTRQGRSDGT